MSDVIAAKKERLQELFDSLLKFNREFREKYGRIVG